MTDKVKVAHRYSLPVSMITITEDGLKRRVAEYVNRDKDRHSVLTKSLTTLSAASSFGSTILTADFHDVLGLPAGAIFGAFSMLTAVLLIFAVWNFVAWYRTPPLPDLVDDIKQASIDIQKSAEELADDGFKKGFDSRRKCDPEWLTPPSGIGS